MSKTVGNSTEIENENNAPRVEVAPDVFLVKSHNSAECVQILRDLEPDLIVLRGCGIVKKQVLEIPKIGVINPHYAIFCLIFAE